MPDDDFDGLDALDALDALMDARLRDAGARWRTANTALAEREGSRAGFTTPTRPPHQRRNWWAIAAAAATVAAVGVGIAVFGSNDGHQPVAEKRPNGMASAPTALSGTWDLATYNDASGQPHTVSGNRIIFIVGRGGRLTATGGCGDLTGHVTVTDRTIDFAGFAYGPAQDCARPSPGSVRVVLYALLSGTAQYAIHGDTLTISRHGYAGRLVYKFAPASPDGALLGAWKLQSPAPNGWLTLTKHGYRVDFRCQRLTGSLHYRAHGLVFGTADVWDHSCPHSLHPGREARQNARIRSVLHGAATWSLKGNTLTIAKGNRRVVLTRH